MPTKQILCLANSRKLLGHCIAGKELTAEGYGGWIRPVSSSTGGGLTTADINYQNGETPKLLDIMSVPLLDETPYFHQSENHLNNAQQYWAKVGEATHEVLAGIEDRVDTLWLNGYHSTQGLNDRIPESIAKESIVSSLLLIRPTTMIINIEAV